MSSIELIAAMTENRVIGKDQGIPFRATGEQKLFKEITLGGVLVMGRKTYESIGKPLPNRTTIIVTRNADYQVQGCTTATSLGDAISCAGQLDLPIFIAGGGEIYQQALSEFIHLVTGIHLTTVHTNVAGDVYFPALPADQFYVESETRYSTNYEYTYQHFYKIVQEAS